MVSLAKQLSYENKPYTLPGHEYPRFSFGRPQRNASPSSIDAGPVHQKDGMVKGKRPPTSLEILPDRRRKVSPPREAYADAMANDNTMLGWYQKVLDGAVGRVGLDGTQGRHKSQRTRHHMVATR